MNPLTLDLIKRKLAFLAVLWLFVIAAVGVVRTDLFDQPASPRGQRRAAKAASRRAPAARPACAPEAQRQVKERGQAACGIRWQPRWHNDYARRSADHDRPGR